MYEKNDAHDREFRVLNVRLNPSLHQTIHQIARDNGESIAATIRSMLRHGVEQQQAVAK